MMNDEFFPFKYHFTCQSCEVDRWVYQDETRIESGKNSNCRVAECPACGLHHHQAVNYPAIQNGSQ